MVYGLKALSPDRVISKQIEAARVALTRYMKDRASLTRVFKYTSFKKPTGLEWVKEKGRQTGHAELSLAEYYLKLMYQKKLLKCL